MTPPEQFLDELTRLADGLSLTDSVSYSFAVGKAQIRIDYFTPDVPRPMNSLPISSGSSEGWRICAWDGAATGRLPPPRPWSATAHEPLGIVKAFSNQHIRCAYDLPTQALIASNLAARRAFIWYPEIASLAAWAHASPFRIPISWALSDQGLQMVHGAAVTRGGNAALLCGNGGAGKSTTALAAALNGFGYVGDDYCAIDTSDLSVHMVYRTAKVLPSTLRLLPEIRDWIVNLDRMKEEKGVIFLQPGQLELVTSAPLKCLFLPRLAQDGEVRLEPASRTDAIHALLPSTVGGLLGGTASTPGHILRLVSRLPAFHLLVGPNLDQVLDLMRGKLDELQ